MDIRNFFASKPPGGANKMSAVKSLDSRNNKKKMKKTKMVIGTEESKTKKRKPKVEEQEETEISPQTFFASSNSSNSQKAPSPQKKAKTAAVPAIKQRSKAQKRCRIEDSDDDEDFKLEPLTADDDDDEALILEDERTTTTPKKNTASATNSRASSSRSRSSSSPKKKIMKSTKTPSPPKKKSKAAASPKAAKIPILEPSLELDSFDSDLTQVPEFMQGLTFVFTGVLPNLHRDDAQDLLKTLGARVTSAVSGKTSFLVCGPELEDGRDYTSGSKYRGATERNIPIILGEKKLYGLCHLYHERAKNEKGITTTSPPPPTAKSSPTAAATAVSTPAANPYTKKTTTTPLALNPYAKKATPPVANPYLKKAVSNPYAKKAAGATTNPYAEAANPYANNSSKKKTYTKEPASKNRENQLWVDRHAPQETHEILGNKENVNKLRNWLNSWERQFNNPKAVGKTFSNPKGPLKAALLSGPPGIGK
jgi:replication factor C subunit 1